MKQDYKQIQANLIVENDELSLLNLIVYLWKLKKPIFLWTLVLGITLALILTFLYQKNYEVSAEIGIPNQTNLSNYFTIEQKINKLIPTQQDTFTPKNQESNKTEIPQNYNVSINEQVLDSFAELIKNNEFIDYFFANNQFAKELKQQNKDDVNYAGNIFAPLNLTLKTSNNKNIYTLKYKSKDPNFALQMVKNVLVTANELNQQKLKQILNTKIDSQIFNLNLEIDLIKTELSEQKRIMIEDLKLALALPKNKISINTVIQNYLGSSDNIVTKQGVNPFLYLMSDAYIKQEIKKIEDGKTIFSPKYAKVSQQISILKQLKNEELKNVVSYNLVKPLPNSLEKSNKFKILLSIGALIFSFFASLVLVPIYYQIRQALSK